MKTYLLVSALLLSTLTGIVFAQADHDTAQHTNPNYSDAKATIKDDADARKKLQAAYETIYSPRAAGLEAFAASLSVKVTAPEVKGQQITLPPLTVNAEITWSKEKDDIDVTIILDFDKPQPKNPLMKMLETGIERALPQLAPELLDGVIGMHSFDQRFDDATISEEKDGTLRVEIERSGDLPSHLVTITNERVSSIDTSSMRIAFEYEKANDKVFLTTISNTVYAEEEDRFGDLEIVEHQSKYTLSDRQDVGGYTFATQAATDITYSGFDFHVVGTLSDIHVDDDARTSGLGSEFENGEDDGEESDTPHAD